MKKISLFLSLFVIAVLLSACAQSTEVTQSPEITQPAADTGSVVLTVNAQEYSKSDLEALGTISVDYTNKDGETTTYSGVSLNALLADAGVTDSNATLTFVATDGYEASVSIQEISGCADCIVAFDDDILRMVLPDFASNLQVKDVVEINISGTIAEQTPAETILTVAGKEYTEADIIALGTMTFDYVDKEGQTVTYTSVALKTVLEDAEVTEEDGMLVFIASDGYEAEVSVSEIFGCNDCILAFNEDGLRTFMPGMAGNLQVKDLVEIKVKEAVAETISEDVILTVSDKEYTKSSLEALGITSVDYTDKDEVTTTYTGVPFSALLEDAGITDETATLVIVASDGYEAEINVGDVLACSNCILAFDEDLLRTVMPDMSGKLQVKDVVEINIK